MTQTTLLDNRFSILHIERTNSFSKVFFALDTYQNPPRNCAIKAYKPISQKPQLQDWIVEEFQQEAARLKQLSLTNEYLPEIYTYFHDSRAYYIARELVEGVTLKEKVQSKEPFSPEMVREILRQLLLMLVDLHQEKVIHQNIKPENIILRDGDLTPISINFGGLEQIVATFDFHGEQNIFSLNDTFGYAPSEQALGKAIPASDLYSLGLSAIYLLTAKNPKDLSIDLDSGNYFLPSQIKARDPNLAETISRAISLNPSDRYNSASEMLDALLTTNKRVFLEPHEQNVLVTSNGTPNKHTVNNGKKPQLLVVEKKTAPSHNEDSKAEYWEKPRSGFNWGLLFLLTIIGLYLSYVGMSALYGWKSVREHSLVSGKDSFLMLPSTLPESEPEIFAEGELPNERKPPLLDNETSNLPEIPIFPIGTYKNQLRTSLGEPNAIQKGYWSNSIAWIYKGRSQGSINLGYLFDLNTNKLRQTEVAIAPDVGLETISEILDSLLGGKSSNTIKQELQKIYNRQTDSYLFRSKNLEGSIERDRDDNIYIGIWEADFH